MKNRIIFLSFFLLGSIALQAQIVTNTNNDGAGSLRQAILDANANSGTDNITFNIPGTGPHTVALTEALPEITDAVVIDGYTQPGASPATASSNAVMMIELDGSVFQASEKKGLYLTSDNSLVKGLVIHDFYYAIQIKDASDNIISGNFIGTDITGANYEGNSNGIYISYDSDYNTIGGTSSADRNIISGSYGRAITISQNCSNNKIQGNYIGTDITGTKIVSSTSGYSLKNSSGIEMQGSQNTIGGLEPGAGNLITGTTYYSILINGGQWNIVQGNLIGTDYTGTDIPGYGHSNGSGVNLWGNNNTVGGNTPQARNVISGNGGGVIIRGTNFSGQKYGNVVQGNYIGTDITGTQNLGNDAYGISLNEARDNTIGGTGPGEANLIAYNGEEGIKVGEGDGNSILANSIHSNGGIGIDLYREYNPKNEGVTINDNLDTDNGGNGLQNYPVLTRTVRSASTLLLEGNLFSSTQSEFTIQFFSNGTADPSGFGEGETYLGEANTTTDVNGLASFSVTLSVSVPAGAYISSTATAPDGSTSEFSEILQVIASGIITDSENDFAAIDENTSLNIDVLANDIVGSGMTKSVVSHDQGYHGEVVLESDGTLTYTPEENYFGSDYFFYTMEDNDGNAARAYVFVTINSVNNAPVLSNDYSVTTENVAQTVSVLDNDYDVEDDPLTILDVTDGDYLTTTLNADNTITYTPTSGYTGRDQFEYTVSDGEDVSTASVLVGVYGMDQHLWVVNTSDDTFDGLCDDNHCSLREAIFTSNIVPGTDNITFNIPGTGPHTVALTEALPEITDAVVIDGYTQPGASPATASSNAVMMIELDGSVFRHQRKKDCTLQVTTPW